MVYSSQQKAVIIAQLYRRRNTHMVTSLKTDRTRSSNVLPRHGRLQRILSAEQDINFDRRWFFILACQRWHNAACPKRLSLPPPPMSLLSSNKSVRSISLYFNGWRSSAGRIHAVREGCWLSLREPGSRCKSLFLVRLCSPCLMAIRYAAVPDTT